MSAITIWSLGSIFTSGFLRNQRRLRVQRCNTETTGYIHWRLADVWQVQNICWLYLYAIRSLHLLWIQFSVSRGGLIQCSLIYLYSTCSTTYSPGHQSSVVLSQVSLSEFLYSNDIIRTVS